MTTADSQQRIYEREAAAAKGPYGDTPAPIEDHSLIRVVLTGEADPNLPSRILDILTIRGDLPLNFHFIRHERENIISVQFALRADEVPFSAQLIDRLLKIPTVISASIQS